MAVTRRRIVMATVRARIALCVAAVAVPASGCGGTRHAAGTTQARPAQRSVELRRKVERVREKVNLDQEFSTPALSTRTASPRLEHLVQQGTAKSIAP
jgi:hypothetical protein